MDGARDGAGLRAAAISIDTAQVHAASEALHRATPHRSAKRVLYWSQALVLTATLYGLMLALEHDARLVGVIALTIAYGLFAVAIAWRLFAAASLKPLISRLAERIDAPWPVYTILCPLYRESESVADLVSALNRIDYPRDALDIKLLVEGDDVDTLATALAVSHDPHIEAVIIPAVSPRTKPKALNVGLARARGEYVVVYDAEDRPHPLQLRAALAAFEDGGTDLACVQAPLVVDNGAASWIAGQFAAEYAIQFHEILPLLARLKLPLPLGGSSNHFRLAPLRESGGWDPYNVTEDMDLGYRLARDGWRSGVIAPPTWEEAPIGFDAWLRQRTRWIKGHLQTWLVLMRDPIGLARETGLAAFLSMQLMLGGGVAAAFLHGPMAAMVIAAILFPTNTLGVSGFVLAVSGYCVGVFATLSAAALSGDLRHIRAAPTMPFYWPLASLAAMRALFDLIVRPHHWAKTAHGVSARARFPFERAALRGDGADAQSAPHKAA